MKSLRIFPTAAYLLGIIISIPLTAHATNNLPTGGAMPDVVYLRKNCETLPNCATTMEEIVPWISNTRQPNAAKPLQVNIGPGQFTGFSCSNGGYTSLRGAGRSNTTIGGPTDHLGVNVNNCTRLDFQDLKVTHKAFAFNTITWTGPGTSTWNNVDVIGGSYAWVDKDSTGFATSCSLAGRSTHYWFGSRITATTDTGSTKAYISQCSASWFYGTEINASVTAEGSADSVALRVVNNYSEAHVYGGAIRASAPTGIILRDQMGMMIPLRAVEAKDGGMIHIHGTGIDANSVEQNAVVALSATNAGTIHANETAYNLSTGSGGTVTRIAKDENPNTHVHAPYQWQHIPDFPLTSITGADITTETVGTDINMLVYNSQCAGSGGPWYNVALRTCR